MAGRGVGYAGTMVRLQDAVRWAAELHFGQERDGDAPLPYITHPLEVLSILRHRAGVTDEDMLCAAALHDTVEETNATVGDIRDRFGERVALLVDELTRREPNEKNTQGLSADEVYELRTTMYMDELRAMSREARLIKLCDRFCNLKEAKRTRSSKKAKRYRDQTRRMLAIIPRDVHPELWDKIDTMSLN